MDHALVAHAVAATDDITPAPAHSPASVTAPLTPASPQHLHPRLYSPGLVSTPSPRSVTEEDYDEEGGRHIRRMLARPEEIQDEYFYLSDSDVIFVESEHNSFTNSSNTRDVEEEADNGGAQAECYIPPESAHDTENIIAGMTAKIARMYRVLDTHDVKRAHICSDLDLYCSSLSGLGWDCGYRNVATLLSSLLLDRTLGMVLQTSGISQVPTISEIARLIEDAWREGYDREGARQYGGTLQGKKVWIGSTEVAVLLHSLGIRARVHDFNTKDAISKKKMLDWIFDYFENACCGTGCQIHRRGAFSVRKGRHIPPIFCQWQGHSVTIVGAEKTRKGETRILIVDPSKSFWEKFRRRRSTPKLHYVRRGENHPQLDVPRFQLLVVDSCPLLHDPAHSNETPPTPPRWSLFSAVRRSPRKSTSEKSG